MQSSFEEASVVHEMFFMSLTFLTICLFAHTENYVSLAANSFLFNIFDKHCFGCITFGGITVLM